MSGLNIFLVQWRNDYIKLSTMQTLDGVAHNCSPGSYKMKISAPGIFLVPATALSILLTLAKYISCTQRNVALFPGYKLVNPWFYKAYGEYTRGAYHVLHEGATYTYVLIPCSERFGPRFVLPPLVTGEN